MGSVKFENIKITNGIVIARTFYGDLTIQEVIDSFEYLLENQLAEDENIKTLITDLTKANLNFKLLEFRSMISIIKRNDKLSKLPMGVITNSPINGIFPAIASKTMGIHIKPCNSFDEAMEWAKSL